VRHLFSFVVAPVLGVVVYVSLGIALTRLDGDSGWSGANVVAGAAAVAAGAAYAALLLPRLSPLGPALVGAGYLALTGWLINDPDSFLRAVADVFGSRATGTAPAEGFTAVLGVPLLATVLSGRRWRRHPDAVGAPTMAYSAPAPRAVAATFPPPARLSPALSRRV